MTTTEPTGLTVPDDEGRPVPIRTDCPEWCDGEHLRYAVENPGLLSAEEIARHSSISGSMFTSDLRNSVGGRLERRGGLTFTWRLRQDPLNPFAPASGWLAGPLVEVDIHDHTGERPVTLTASLVPGEARSLAAVLVALADRAELHR